MTTAVRTAATKRPPMDSMRKTALVAGILYLITFISVATLTLYSPVLKDPAYILSSGSDAGLRWGALIDVIVALAGIGTAITLYPVVRRQNEDVRARIRHLARHRGRDAPHGCREPSLARVPAPGGRRGRRRLDRASHQWRLVRRDVQRGVPDRRDPHARDECPPARVPDVPIQPRAATHSRDRTRRRRLDDVFRDRTDPRHQREDLGCGP